MSKNASAAFDDPRAGDDENIRGDGEDAMLLHGCQRSHPLPQSHHLALVRRGHVHGVGHVAHVDNHLRIARQNFFQRTLGYCEGASRKTFSPPAVSMISFR